MSTFHEEIAGRIERHLKERRMVVFYDPRREFEPFVRALRAGAETEDDVKVGGSRAWLRRYEGSYLSLRHAVEQRLQGGEPTYGLVYVAGEERDRTRSALMEYDLAGHTYEPQLRKLARDILRERFSDGQIDGFLAPAGVGYAEIASYFEQGSEETSILRLLYGNIGSESILSRWILDEERDAELSAKGAVPELRALIRSRVGLDLSEAVFLPAARRELTRYVLINEFRMDLGGASPGALELIREPMQKEQRERIRAIAEDLRGANPVRYGALADEVESDLRLAGLSFDARDLGAIDTFRFEERRLLEEAARRLAAGQNDVALELARGRENSHWVRTNPRRLAQWSALQQAAILGQRVRACRAEVEAVKGKAPDVWIERYTAEDGWSAVDGLDRRLGAFLSAMDEEPVAAHAIAKVRQEYAEWVRVLSEGFTPALAGAEWDAGWGVHQTQVFDTRVKPGTHAVAFFVVDAFRHEMAQELAGRLDRAGQLSLEAAVAALPTITPVGMAALLPGASGSFSVQPIGGGIAGAIEGTPLPDWPARWKHLQARVPGSVEIRLEQLLHMSSEAISEHIKSARLVLVRSQDIDAVGEAGVGLVAQQAMATVIPNLARAVHRLSKAGIRRFVVSADHGHLLDETQDDDMKIETPGGETVELHRRCWAGRGGKTPTGAVRVSGANLGYDTDLDFVFPTGRGVFLSGGGLRYHHGGLSLQELIVPVLSITMEQSSGGPGSGAKVQLHDVPEKITNRTIGVRVELASDLFSGPQWVRVVLLDQAEQVGEAGMVQGATIDPRTKRIQLTPGQPATVGLMLSRDDCKTVKLVVLDAETEAVLAQSKNLTVSLSI
jgi:hypothetical protein